MSNIKRNLAVLVLLVLAIAGCRKKAYDEFYGRPDTLEPPIYQVLTAKGNFKNILAAIDKAGYKSTLAAAGYWTFFAPHDSAFTAYFREKGITGIDQLDSNACRQIVTYSLVYNAFKKERIGDFQSTTTIGWVPNQAFKRRTASYTGVYNTKNLTGADIKAIAVNRNGGGTYVDADNNNKYIPYFVDNFMTTKSLTATDYNYFYPNTQYTGFNVVDAIVTEKDIPAENGVIHVVNRVISSLPSIDEYIGTKPEYSEFKKLFDKYLVSYVLNEGVTAKYNNINGTALQVFTKFFGANAAYSLNNENFIKTQDNDGQQDSYSIFVPTNTVLLEYFNRVLLENYKTLENLPPQIIYDFVNAHMWLTAVWPSKFNTTFNAVNEEARFNPATDIIDKKILSNGIFYGTNKVQEANVFTSVYGRAYLDPKYSMMISLLGLELKSQISNIYRNYTIFMISNDMFNAAGYRADPSVSINAIDQWRFEPKAGSAIPASTGGTTRARLQRILNMHVVPNRVLANLSAEGVALTYGGEYIGFKNNTIYGPGNVDSNNVAISDSTKTSRNGRVFYAKRLMEFSEALVGVHLEKLGGASAVASQYYNFFQYLKNSTIWNATTKEITGVANGVFFTFFVPNNAAIAQAVRDGSLPGTGTGAARVPNFSPTLTQEKEQVVNFILLHILNKRLIGADQVESGSMETLVKNNVGDPVTVFVNNSATGIKVTDASSRLMNVISPLSSYLSNRAFIYLTDNYLKY